MQSLCYVRYFRTFLCRSFLRSLWARLVAWGLGRRLEHQAKEVGEVRRQVDRLGEEVEHHVEGQMVHPPEEVQPLQDPAVVPGEVEAVLREEVKVAQSNVAIAVDTKQQVRTSLLS